MSNIKHIVDLAIKEYPQFMNDIINNDPDLYLKFMIDESMLNFFVEAVVNQFWVQEVFDKSKIIDFMKEKYYSKGN